MNEETRDYDEDETFSDSQDEAIHMVNALQDEVDSLSAELAEARATITRLEAAPAPQPTQVAPAGDAELRALATTYRTAVRNGHPDAPKHLETLLRALGA